MNLRDMIVDALNDGYSIQDARAKVCQDIILTAISKSDFSRNVTIKGGVVMRSRTGNIRRATQDMDIDFIRYSLSDESIDIFIQKINCLPDITIEHIGKITELNQQDYHGKSLKILIKDKTGVSIESKMDLGVHSRMDMEQEEYCFDISYTDENVSLLINSMEQMFTEKLRSLLKFGVFSTRYKDIYDMYYFCDKIDKDKLEVCLNSYIFLDESMRENNMSDVVNRITKIFQNKDYCSKVDGSDKRWLDASIDEIFETILKFLSSIAI